MSQPDQVQPPSFRTKLAETVKDWARSVFGIPTPEQRIIAEYVASGMRGRDQTLEEHRFELSKVNHNDRRISLHRRIKNGEFGVTEVMRFSLLDELGIWYEETYRFKDDLKGVLKALQKFLEEANQQNPRQEEVQKQELLIRLNGLIELTQNHITILNRISEKNFVDLGTALETWVRMYEESVSVTGIRSILNEIGVAMKEVGLTRESQDEGFQDFLQVFDSLWREHRPIRVKKRPRVRPQE